MLSELQNVRNDFILLEQSMAKIFIALRSTPELSRNSISQTTSQFPNMVVMDYTSHSLCRVHSHQTSNHTHLNTFTSTQYIWTPFPHPLCKVMLSVCLPEGAKVGFPRIAILVFDFVLLAVCLFGID